MNATISKADIGSHYSEAARMLDFLRAIGTEDQRIAYAVLEGMRLQKKLDAQAEDKPRPRSNA